MEALCLDRGIGRDASKRRRDAIAAFEPPTVALRIEVGGQMIPKGEAVRGHPMVGEGKGCGEIGRTVFRRAIDASLESITLAAAEALRQAPIGPAAGERKAHDGIGCEAVIESAGKAHRARGQVVAADECNIAAGAVAAAISAAPHRPTRLIDRRRLWRRLQHRGIGVGDVGGHVFALRRKAERRVIGAANAAAAIYEGIKHQVQELVGELEADFLRAGSGFAGELAQPAGEIGAGKPEDAHEARRQRTAIVEEIVERIGDIELVEAQTRSAGRAGLTERGGEVQDRVGRGVAEIGGEAGGQIGGCQIAERRAVEPAPGRQDGIHARHVAARGEGCSHSSSERGTTARNHIGARCVRRIDLHQVERARLEREIAGNRHRAGGITGGERAAAVDGRRAHRAGAGEYAAVVDGHRGIGDRAVHHQRTGADRGRAGIGVGRSEHQDAGADLGEAAATANDAGERGIIAIGAEGAAAGVERDRAVGGEPREELQRAAAEGEAARGGAKIGVGRDREHAAIDERTPGMGVGGGEDGRSRTDLRECARSGDDAAEGEGVGPIDGEDAVVEHVAENGAGRPPIAKLQRAGVDDGAAGISRISGDRQRADAVFHQRAIAHRSVGQERCIGHGVVVGEAELQDGGLREIARDIVEGKDTAAEGAGSKHIDSRIVR